MTGIIVAWAWFAAPVGAVPADTNSVPASHLVITEIGVATAIQNSRKGGDDVCGNLALGYLARTGERTMIGGEVGIMLRDVGMNVAVRPRLRRELNRSWSMNLAAGPVVHGSVDSQQLSSLGFSAAAGLDYRGYVGVRVEVQRLGYVAHPYYAYPNAVNEHVTTTLLGVHLGKTPARAAVVGLAILGFILVATADPWP